MYNEDDRLCFFHRRVTAVGQGKRQEEEKSWKQERGRKAIEIGCCFTSVVLRWEAVVDGLAGRI